MTKQKIFFNPTIWDEKSRLEFPTVTKTQPRKLCDTLCKFSFHPSVFPHTVTVLTTATPDIKLMTLQISIVHKNEPSVKPNWLHLQKGSPYRCRYAAPQKNPCTMDLLLRGRAVLAFHYYFSRFAH